MNINWVNDAVFYHIYPLGFCGAPKYNEGETAIIVLNASDNQENIPFQYEGKQYNLLLQGKTSWIGGIS